MKSVLLAVVVAMLGAGVASAHVTIKPNQVGVGAFQTFTVGVPNEKDIVVTGVRLVMPSGLGEVSVTVKPGWTVQTQKSGDEVTEISWSGGSIPAEQRDDFTFSAQAPADPTDLQWKAYQTYEDGTVVSWDQDPAVSKDAVDNKGPFSVTNVVNDLTSSTPVEHSTPLWLGIIATVLGLAGIGLSFRRR
jgi:uncharacterized protein YcnI